MSEIFEKLLKNLSPEVELYAELRSDLNDIENGFGPLCEKLDRLVRMLTTKQD